MPYSRVFRGNPLPSPELLQALRYDSSSRRAVGEADILTINIGLNDLGRATQAYENGTCGGGGADTEDCLGVACERTKVTGTR